MNLLVLTTLLINIQAIQINNASVIVATPAGENSSKCIWRTCPLFQLFTEKYNVNFEFKSWRDVNDAEFLTMFLAELPENYTYILPMQYYYSGFMVPNLVEMDKSQFFMLPFQPWLWAMIVAGIFYFASIRWIVFDIFERPLNFFVHVLDSLYVTLCTKAPKTTNSHILNIIQFLMIWYGVIMTNLYCAFLGSYILAPLGRNADTIIYNEDNRPIIDHHHPSIFESKFKMVGVPFDTYNDLYTNANPTFGYFINNFIWDNNFASGKGEKLFRKLDSFVRTDIVNSLIIRKNSVYKDDFEEFYLDMWSYGYIKKFTKFGAEVKFPPNSKNTEVVSSFSLHEIVSVVRLLGFGLGFSGFVFVIEIFSQCSLKVLL